MSVACCYKYFSTPKTNKSEKEEAAKVSASFTKKFPIYFPSASITHKMHLLGFVFPKVIRNDTTDNILYKILKVEQAGERLHQKWNMCFVVEKTQQSCVKIGKNVIREAFTKKTGETWEKVQTYFSPSLPLPTWEHLTVIFLSHIWALQTRKWILR